MKNERLFQIVNLLIQNKVLTAKELAEKVGVSLRTIYRDVDSLSILGIPIYTLQGKSGGIAIMEDYKIDKAVLTEEERDTILLALENFQLPEKNIGALLEKLGALFQKENPDWMEIDFTRWGKEKKDTNKFDYLKKALLNHIEMKISYCSYKGEDERNIYPLKLIYKSKEWYIWAYCLKAEDYRLFKVNRILKYSLTMVEFDKRKYTKKICFSEEESEDMVNIILKFNSSVGFRIYDEFVTEVIRKNDVGDYIVTAKIPRGAWIYGYILSFGNQVEVLAPQSVREEIKKLGESIGKLYER
ncbi:YafY family protein [Clostridium sp. C2-6-12]|uniref:helix-turn-helix transcriptional regulator n=1 Tax=Clostridium sp. C2-6-12 TaxID=2698832 RepID=UPI00136E004D|nr:YafY family protein [Clostridium sp. C2-6-12]